MSLLPAALSERLLCPACGGSDLNERDCPHTPGSGTIRCAVCGRHHLVVDRVAVLTQPIPPPPEDEPILEWAERDGAARKVVHAALGRFAGMLGGLAGCMALVDREQIEEAFDVPGAAWISLERFDSPRNEKIAEELGGGGAVLDIGCGYGATSVPFARAGRDVVGADENLLFLLLFSRYAREHDLPGASFACVDVAGLPLPFHDQVFGGVLAASFFNHYACLKSRAELREFLDEVARVAAPGGGFVADMVPNRLHPFPSEINLGEVITEPKLRRSADAVLRRVPVRWLPGRLTVAGLWAVYRVYCAARRRPAFGLADFRHEVSRRYRRPGWAGCR